jgi:hypothetical protein
MTRVARALVSLNYYWYRTTAVYNYVSKAYRRADDTFVRNIACLKLGE